MNKIFFLTPQKGTATKEFAFENNKWVLKTNYKAGKFFNGYDYDVNNIEECYEILKENQEYNCFFIHGEILDSADRVNMIRRVRDDHQDGMKPTIGNRPINFFCLDIDGFDGTIEEAISHLPKEFQTADYIYQFSSSYALTSEPNILKCHLFFWLEKAILNTKIKEWIKQSDLKWLDPSVLNAAQPVYIQKRVCLNKEDPINQYIGLVHKDGCLKWSPEYQNKNQNKKSNNNYNFNLQKSVERILTAERYHDELNSTALSLINRKIPAGTVKSLLKGAMNAAKIKDQRWKDRYMDIDRTVDSAVNIVNNPTIEEVIDWIQNEETKIVKADFAQKCMRLSPIDRTTAIHLISKKIGYGIRDIQKTIKIAEEEWKIEQAQMAREKQTLERLEQGIFEIECTPSNSGECAERAGNILAKSTKEPQVFVMGGQLASVVMGQPKTIQQCNKYHSMGIDYPKMPIISIYRKPFYKLAGRLEKDVVFINEKGQDIPASAPILYMIGEAENQNFKPLTGVVEHPFIDRNWNVVQTPGYNKKTGLYTVLHHKLKLCKMDPKKAYKYLTDIVFDEFPFNSELDKAVAVAALMTAIQRPTIAGDSGMPGFGIISPTQSSGKTTLAQLISYSIYNRPVAAQSWTDDEEELGKHLLGIFQEGHSCVLFDNIRQGAAIQSGRLANAMSNDMFGGRQLGENKIIQVPSSVVWLFTGNGISFVGDFATRIYPISINPKMESPDTRKFKRSNIGQWAMDNRKKIISAILSIIIDGKDMPEIGGSTRFKEWDEFIRRPLYKVSGIDVNEAIKKNQKEDLTKISKINLITQLYDVFESKHFTTKDIVKMAFNSFEGEDTELGDALIDALGNKAQNTMSIGRFLGAMVDSVFGNLTLIKYTSNIVKWQIKEIKEEE